MRLVRHVLFSSSSSPVLVPADQIQQREQENPDDIHKVPVKAAQFYGRVITWAEFPAFGAQQKPRQESQANHHVKSVQAGHGKVEREEDLGLLRGLHGRRFRFAWILFSDLVGNVAELWVGAAAAAPGIEAFADNVAGNVAFVVLVVIFLGFYAQEGRAQNHGADQEPDLPLASSGLG